MSLPPSQGYYVTDRVDLVPPPPPRPHSQMQHRGPYPLPGHSAHGHHAGPASAQAGPPGNSYGQSQAGPPPGNSYNYAPSGNPTGPQTGTSYQQSGPQSHGPPPGGPSRGPPGSQGPQGAMPYDEWQATPPPPPGAGKIVNRPPNPYKDQFKPSYVSGQIVVCHKEYFLVEVSLSGKLTVSIFSGVSRRRRRGRSSRFRWRARTAWTARRQRRRRSRSRRRTCTCCELSRSWSTGWISWRSG